MLMCPAHCVSAGEPEAHRNATARHDRPPRKVIVGTTMTPWYGDYPGLSGRLEQMRGLIDAMAAESRARYGRSIDLALFTEWAVTAGKPGAAAHVGVPLDDAILTALGSKAREHNSYIVFGGVFLDDPAKGACSNAAVVIDRKGRQAGRCVKVHPVLDRVGPGGQIVLEGGVRPGTEYEAFGDRVGYRYSESEDRGIFWSNDRGRSIGEMARSLGLLESATEKLARARLAQDSLRGGPAR
jgi:hypothetical protein